MWPGVDEYVCVLSDYQHLSGNGQLRVVLWKDAVVRTAVGLSYIGKINFMAVPPTRVQLASLYPSLESSSIIINATE